MRFWHRGTMKPGYEEMLKLHRVSFQPSPSTLDPTKISYVVVEIDESNLAWEQVRKQFNEIFFWTEFSCEEIKAADFAIGYARHSIRSLLSAEGGWDPHFIAGRCQNCGSGWRQIAPFRIKKEPKLGKNVFADFGSAFEVFCAPVVLETFRNHEISGFETRPLILNKEDRPAQSLKQLIVTEIADPAIAEDLVERERYSQTDCPICGRTWHAHYTRGALPLRRAALKRGVDLQLTNEWFGNGRTARREILFSRRAVALVLENKWHGIEFVPVRVV
jgi:hypothetical protein